MTGVVQFTPPFMPQPIPGSTPTIISPQSIIANPIVQPPINKDHKIDGKFLGAGCKLTDQEIDDKLFEMFTNAFDPNSFDDNFVKSGGNKPPSQVITLLQNIATDITNGTLGKNIDAYIFKYMRTFMNNRIGTYLKK